MTMKDLLLEYEKAKEDLSNKENRLTEQELKIQFLNDTVLKYLVRPWLDG